MDESKQSNANDLDSLESSTTVVEPNTKSAESSKNNSKTDDTVPIKPSKPTSSSGSKFLRPILRFLNLYLLFFILLIVLTGIGGVLLYLKAHQEYSANNGTPASQSLSASALDNLANSDVTVGEPKHTLSVQSNAEFTGSVLIRSNLQVAGTLQVGSNLAINGVRVTGNSTLDDVQVTKSIAVTGNGSFQGQLTVQQSLDVNGGATFLGSVSAPALVVGGLQLNGDLGLTHHISAGGSTPSRSNGSALGSGGTVSVSGSDTAGSVTINTGSGPSAGCFTTVTFTKRFNSTPHITVTPVNSGAASLQYYITRTTSAFSICSTNAAPANTTFGFDYVSFD